jgi:tryptophan-rich sensory protein
MSVSASPRSCPPQLARSSPIKPSRGIDGALYWARLTDYILPVLLVAAVVAAAVLCWIARCHSTYAREHCWPEFAQSGPLAGFVLLVVLCLVAYGTACAYRMSDYTGQMVLLGTFVAVVVLLAVALWLSHRSGDHHTAFYVMIAVAIVALVHAFYVWRTMDTMALVCCVPFLVLVAFLLYRYWRACCHVMPMMAPPAPGVY